MDTKNTVAIIGGIIGAIGGTLGIISWIKTYSKENRSFNQITYNKHIRYTYKQCFENSECPETDNVNLYFVWRVIENLKEFQRLENKFKGVTVKSDYNNAFIYSDVIKFDHSIGFNWALYDIEVNSKHSISDYEQNKIHIQRLKPFFKEFYLSVFENLD
ncbi:MAG: hypothetical protein Q8L81_10910 [Bacteroidota bacterium]|nr:hypothetical protein [Bacteroidota bacterium]